MTDIEFLEMFALGNRDKALQKLIPGTDIYRFYQALAWEHRGEMQQVAELLDNWKSNSEMRREIERRYHLHCYHSDTQNTIRYIKKTLNLHFNHTKMQEEADSEYPGSLDQAIIARERLKKNALKTKSLKGFCNRALSWLMEEASSLDLERRNQLLKRLRHPDYPNLPALLLEQLEKRESEHFGSKHVHKLLFLNQLDELARSRPSLRDDREFIDTYIQRLLPGADSPWPYRMDARADCLKRLWDFAGELSPAFNDIKCIVIYHWLDAERRRGRYDRGLFDTYLQIPKTGSYVNQHFLSEKLDRHVSVASLQGRFDHELLESVDDDEPLVRDYLNHFFVEDPAFEPEKSYQVFSKYIDSGYLKKQFALAKLSHDQGDAQVWLDLLNDAAGYRRFRDQVELEFTVGNAVVHGDDHVELELDLKNVPTLLVKVFEINTLNYYLAHGKPVDTTVDLDGLVASEETVYHYEHAPHIRFREKFSFENLRRPGVYVIECIGNGRSSRAVVNKGFIQAIGRTGAAGHVFTVYDHAFDKLHDASIWLGQSEFKANDRGEIIIPFSTQPQSRTFLVRHHHMTALQRFQHLPEQYTLDAAIWVDREQLLPGARAQVWIGAQVRVGEAPASVQVLEEIRLTVSMKDLQGIESSLEVEDFELFDDKESVYTFQVPSQLQTVDVQLSAQVNNLSSGERETLRLSRLFEINDIDRSDYVDDLHLLAYDGGYRVFQLGKSGEPRGGQAVLFVLTHRDFIEDVEITLQTDEYGSIELGELKDISRIRAVAASGREKKWATLADQQVYPRVMHIQAGGTVALAGNHPDRAAVSLLRKGHQGYIENARDSIQLQQGRLSLTGLAAGEYELHLHDKGIIIDVVAAEGKLQGNWLQCNHRLLQVSDGDALDIASLSVSDGKLRIQLSGHHGHARVHVLAGTFVSENSLFRTFQRFSDPVEEIPCTAPQSLYVSGRDIGDEYRYILERKYATRFPGNMLETPGLLLNPWAVRKTDTEVQDARTGDAYALKSAAAPRAAAPNMAKKPVAMMTQVDGNLDFLAPSRVLSNLVVGENAVVTVDLSALGGYRLLRVMAVDGRQTVLRYLCGGDRSPPPVKDLRLAQALPREGRYAEKYRVSLLKGGESLVIEDAATANMELVENLGRVYGILSTLSRNPVLAEFAFLMSWPSLSRDKKFDYYSRYACHELHLFLSRKDVSFFNAVVKPYLANKYHQTFLDHYLLDLDLENYLDPWKFGRLNVMERLLLLKRLGRQEDACSYARSLFELVPADVVEARRQFETVLRGRVLEAGEDFADTGFANEPMFAAGGAAPESMAQEEIMADMALDDLDDLDYLEVQEKESDYKHARDDVAYRSQTRRFFRQQDQTEEFAENNYYQLPIDEQTATLIGINGFWRDFALHEHGPFLSRHFPQTTNCFSEMLCALALLDLPFRAKPSQIEQEPPRQHLLVQSACLVFHKELAECEPETATVPVLVTRNYMRKDDRYDYEDGDSREKYIRGGFLTHVVYECQVVLTNSSSVTEKLDVLLQIPAGALPVSGGFYTETRPVKLGPYCTETIQYSFYFPRTGTFEHYPVQVSRNEKWVAAAGGEPLQVVERLPETDTGSWPYLSQFGEPEQVLAFLQQQNINRVELSQIAWRMKDKDFFRRVLELLRRRCHYDHTLWSYAIYHLETEAIAEFLKHEDRFIRGGGLNFHSDWIDWEPVARHWYEHLQYYPLVNARAHPLGAEIKILNEAFARQYPAFLRQLQYRAKPDNGIWLAACYYYFLQGRVEQALAAFDQVEREQVGSHIQYDYLYIYVCFYRGHVDDAYAVALSYQNYPVLRWRRLFEAALAQFNEISGDAAAEITDENTGDSAMAEKDSSDREHERLATGQPRFDFVVKDDGIHVNHANLDRLQLNFYKMDIELLFSRQPFVKDDAGRFSIIMPGESRTIDLDGEHTCVALPEDFQNSNMVVELCAGGQCRSQVNYAHDLLVQAVEAYGRLTVKQRSSGSALASVYIKVFARFDSGEVRFYKDGYTDLRGAFDYVSLSTDELDQVDRFALLIMSDDHGALVLEAPPPGR